MAVMAVGVGVGGVSSAASEIRDGHELDELVKADGLVLVL